VKTNSGPEAPEGGFFISVDKFSNIVDLRQKLMAKGAETHVLSDYNLVLASFKEFPGQGSWLGQNGAIVYDLDLTNESELRILAGYINNECSNSGELLWALYQKYGFHFLDHLRGSYGFALWDSQKRALYVVTDPYGIRPVVYTHLSAGLVAASRIRHVLIHPEVPRDINPEAVFQYFFFSTIPSPISIYKSILKLEPGKGVTYKDNHLENFTHYDIQYRPDYSVKKSQWIRSIPHRIEKAVATFVPLSNPQDTGCFLSGGTDSSSVVGYYRKLSGRTIKTFSIGFHETDYDELYFANVAARQFDTEQYDYFVTPKEVLDLINTLPKIYDESFGNSSVVPVYHCARLAQEAGVSVLLAGDGGDEIFGGNERYTSNILFELYHKLPVTLRQDFLEPFIIHLPAIAFIYKAKRYIRRANFTNPERFFSYNLLAEKNSSEIFHHKFLSGIDTDCFINLAKCLYNQVAPAHDTDRLLYIDMKLTITDNDLRKVTQMVESAGLRVRYPLLDRDLVDFTATIPPNLKVKLGRERYIFKRAMRSFLPREIIKKKKHGMGLPIAPWFKKDRNLAELLNDTLFAGIPLITEYVRPEFLLNIKSAFESDSTSYYGSNLWVFLMLELWLKSNKGKFDI
jgi:asparagine synthase (glutamine-hydrolysing)